MLRSMVKAFSLSSGRRLLPRDGFDRSAKKTMGDLGDCSLGGLGS